MRVLERKERKTPPLSQRVVHISKLFPQQEESKCQQGFAIYSESIWTLVCV